MFQNKKIRVFVRNKSRYNPAAKEYGFLHVDIANFAGTTVGNIKENVKRQCKNSLKLDDLFLNHEKLADDRSVAHYNLEDGTILEATSNPFLVTCVFIKQYEVEQTQKNNPDDPAVQKWTTKSFNRKKTLLSVLLNSKNEYAGQPPHFPTVNDFVIFLERLNKKGARMNPLYTQRDLQQMQDDFVINYVGKSRDPLGMFIHQHSIRLGIKQPENGMVQNINDNGVLVNVRNSAGLTRPNTTNPRKQTNNGRGGRKKKVQHCEDCEEGQAEVYCPECQNATGGQGLSLCQACSQTIHRGAARRGHKLQDIDNAPKVHVSKPYIPHAFKAPFSILVALYSGMTETPPILSMTEGEIKEKAQPLTDTDLSDKQNGRYVGGFECMENCLMPKHLVQREDSANPTYALTELGHQLARKLFQYQQSVQRFLRSHDFPQIPHDLSTVCGTRKVCLIIDEQERDRGRFLQLAAQWGIDAQVRSLPVGDYIWILTPPLQGPDVKYTQRQPSLEKVLPFIVERKGWEDLDDSVRTKRFHKQIIRMLGSGVPHCFYLLEGSISSLRFRTEQQQRKLKDEIENLFMNNGFYINYTASWYKTATWLKWFTVLLSSAVNKGLYREQCQLYTEFARRGNVQPKSTIIPHTDSRKTRHTVWPAQQFIDNIFRASRGLKQVVDSVKEELPSPKDKQILIIQGLEAYSKKRQTLQNKCLYDTCDHPDDTEDIVRDSFSTSAFNMVHYDIMCHRQLQIQIFARVYIMRTENDQGSVKITDQLNNNSNDITSNRPSGQSADRSDDTEELMMQQALAKSKQETASTSTGISSVHKSSKEYEFPTLKHSTNKSPLKSKQHIVPVLYSDSQDEDLKRALELSRQSAYDQGLNQSDEPETESVMYRSKTKSSKSLPTDSAVAMVTGQSDSQDEDLKRALELSIHDHGLNQLDDSDTESVPYQLKTKSNKSLPADFAVAMVTGQSDSQDEDIRKALELSKQSMAVVQSDSQDQELQPILEISQLEQSKNKHLLKEPKCSNSTKGKKQLVTNSDSQDEEFEKILKISLQEYGQDKTKNHNTHLDSNDDSQDKEFQKVLKLSQLESSLNRHSSNNLEKENTLLHVSDTVCSGVTKISSIRGDSYVDSIENKHKPPCLSLDGAEEMCLALTQSLPVSQQRGDNYLETLSEEEQLRIAIEQSQLDLVKEKAEILVQEGKEGHYLKKDENLEKLELDGDENPIILIDSQETEYSDSCVICEEDSQNSYINEQAESQFSDEEETNRVVNTLVQIQNQNFIESQVQNESTLATELLDDNIDDRCVQSPDCEKSFSSNKCFIEKGGKSDENGSCKIKNLQTDKSKLLGLDELPVVKDSDNEKVINVLVDDSQGDCESQSDFEREGSCTVPETLGCTFSDDKCEDDIDVIPPSPEKESPLHRSILSRVTTPKMTGKLNTDQSDCSKCVKNEDIEVNNMLSLETQHSQSVSILTGFGDFSSKSGICKCEMANQITGIGNNPVKQGLISDKTEMIKSMKTGDLKDLKIHLKQTVVPCPGKVKVEPCNTFSEEKEYDFKASKVKVESKIEQCMDDKNETVPLLKNSTFGPDKSLELHNNFSSHENSMEDIFEGSHSSSESTPTRLGVRSEINDEEYARKIQEEINQKLEEEERMKKEIKRRQTQSTGTCETDLDNNQTDCNSMNSVDQDLDVRSDQNHHSNDCADDEEFARRLQETLNRGGHSPTPEKRKLRKRKHTEISTDREPELFVSLQEVISQYEVEENIQIKCKREEEDRELARRIQNDGGKCNLDVSEERKMVTEKQDEELARRLQEHEKGVNENPKEKFLREKQDYELAKSFFEDKNDVCIEEEDDMEEVSLQQENQDKMLALEIQKSEKTASTKKNDHPPSPRTKHDTQTAVEMLWDRKLKTNLNAQLQQIRQSQNARYRSGNLTATTSSQETTAASGSSTSEYISGTPTSSCSIAGHRFGISGTPTTKVHHRPDSTTPFRSPNRQQDYYRHLQDDSDDIPSVSPPHSPAEKKPYLSRPLYFSSSQGASSSASWYSTSPSKKHSFDSQSCPNSGSQCTSSPLNNTSTGSQSNSSSQYQSSQTTGNMVNVTCGNCREKGHNRRWVQCPRYHAYEETQRRQKHELEARERTEERQNRDQQTQDELERHKTNLELIAAQIEEEKDGLVKTIKKLNKKGKKKK